MKKNNGFLGSLQKSTKVTLLSCCCFIALTLLILIFFILFPITPSKKIMESIGRGNIAENSQNTNANIVTTAESSTPVSTDVSAKETTTRTAKTYNIVITKGSGFLWNGRNPAIDNTKTTVVISDDPVYPTPDPGYVYPAYTEPASSPSEQPVDTEPVGSDIPPVGTDVPVWTEPPVVTDVPVWTEPPVVTDPPVVVDPQPPVVTDPPVVVDPQPPVVVDPQPPVGGGENVSEW